MNTTMLIFNIFFMQISNVTDLNNYEIDKCSDIQIETNNQDKCKGNEFNDQTELPTLKNRPIPIEVLPYLIQE